MKRAQNLIGSQFTQTSAHTLVASAVRTDHFVPARGGLIGNGVFDQPLRIGAITEKQAVALFFVSLNAG